MGVEVQTGVGVDGQIGRTSKSNLYTLLKSVFPIWKSSMKGSIRKPLSWEVSDRSDVFDINEG